MKDLAEPTPAAFPEDVKTVFYGIGAQKAATSWLFRQLISHPEVHMPMPKELHYWDCIRPPHHNYFDVWSNYSRDTAKLWHIVAQIRALRDPRAQGQMERNIRHADIFGNDPYDHAPYVAHMVRRLGGKTIVGEITPEYALMGSGTFREMASLHPNSRFIFILRDPVSRLWSGVCFRHRNGLSRNVVSTGSLVRAFIAAAEDPQSPDRARSDYEATLKNLYSGVASDQILVLFYETLMEQASVETLRRFLDLKALPISQEVVHGSKVKIALPAEAAARARAALAPIYDALAERFGDSLPSKWRQAGGSA